MTCRHEGAVGRSVGRKRGDVDAVARYVAARGQHEVNPDVCRSGDGADVVADEALMGSTVGWMRRAYPRAAEAALREDDRIFERAAVVRAREENACRFGARRVR